VVINELINFSNIRSSMTGPKRHVQAVTNNYTGDGDWTFGVLAIERLEQLKARFLIAD
jgi:hypothetical protein